VEARIEEGAKIGEVDLAIVVGVEDRGEVLEPATELLLEDLAEPDESGEGTVAREAGEVLGEGAESVDLLKSGGEGSETGGELVVEGGGPGELKIAVPGGAVGEDD